MRAARAAPTGVQPTLAVLRSPGTPIPPNRSSGHWYLHFFIAISGRRTRP